MRNVTQGRRRINARARQRGAALVEFALCWTLMWMLFAGIYQFGYAFYVYNQLMTAVANASQVGSKMPFDMTDGGSTAISQLKNYVVYGDATGGTTPIAPGLSTSNVSVSFATDASGVPHDVTVKIQNYSINAIFTNFSMNGKPRATAIYLGTIACAGC